MNPTKIFGPIARDTHSYVGWLEANQSGGCRLSTEGGRRLIKAYNFLSQPLQERWFVRPKEPDRGYWVTRINPDGSEYMENPHEYDDAVKSWQSWQPMFLGEWDIGYNASGEAVVIEICYENLFIGYLDNIDSLDEFFSICKRLGVELKFNPKFNA